MQWKEDKNDDFEKFWQDAFQDEHMSPPSGLWEDIENDVDQINKKKNHYTFLKSVAALITVSLLTSFLVKYEAPHSTSFALDNVKERNIEMASMVSSSLYETDAIKEISVLNNNALPIIEKVRVNTPPPMLFTEKKDKRIHLLPFKSEVIVTNNKKEKVQFTELGLVKRSSPSIQTKDKRKQKVYIGGEIEMVHFDPNIKMNNEVVSEKTVTTAYGVNAGVQFDKGYFVETGVKYSEYNYKTGLTDLGKIAQKVISVPVKVGYAIDKNKIRLALHTALATNIIVDQSSTDNLSDSILDKSVYLSGQIGAELSYKLSPKSSVSLGTTYGVSLTDLSQDQQVSALSNSYTVSMGFKYNII